MGAHYYTKLQLTRNPHDVGNIAYINEGDEFPTAVLQQLIDIFGVKNLEYEIVTAGRRRWRDVSREPSSLGCDTLRVPLKAFFKIYDENAEAIDKLADEHGLRVNNYDVRTSLFADDEDLDFKKFYRPAYYVGETRDSYGVIERTDLSIATRLETEPFWTDIAKKLLWPYATIAAIAGAVIFTFLVWFQKSAESMNNRRGGIMEEIDRQTQEAISPASTPLTKSAPLLESAPTPQATPAAASPSPAIAHPAATPQIAPQQTAPAK